MATMQQTSSSIMADRLARVCINLRPFQSLEFDPETNMLCVVTESLVPSRAIEQLTKILCGRRNDEKLTVRRFDDAYKVSLIREIKIS